jgi:hypothetical protein
MTGGAAAVLTGLIFVAVSLKLTTILETTVHRDRAWASLVLFLSQLFVAMAMLVPSQPKLVLGLELDLIALFWVYRSLWANRELGPTMRALDRTRAMVRWQVEWLVWVAWLVALVAGAIALTFGSGVGLPLVALAMVGMFGFGVWNAWVLVSETIG